MRSRRGTSDTAASLRTEFSGAAFTTAQAQEAGVSARRLGLAAEAGYVVRLRRGLYVVPEPATQAPLATATSASPDSAGPALRQPATPAPLAVARHQVLAYRARGIPACLAEEAAASSWGLPHGPLSLATIHVPRGSTLHIGTRHGVRMRERDVDDAVTFRGVPTTSPLATARDLCRGLPRHQAVALFGMAQRRLAEWLIAGDERMDPADLTHALADPHWRAELSEAMRGMLADSSRARAWCASADPRPESYLEAISWGRFTGWKLGEMTPQAWVRGASGRRYRVDVLIDGVAGEADGAIKYATGDTLWKEKRRQEDIEQGGTPVVRWTFAEVEHHPEHLRQRWRRALARHAA